MHWSRLTFANLYTSASLPFNLNTPFNLVGVRPFNAPGWAVYDT